MIPRHPTTPPSNDRVYQQPVNNICPGVAIAETVFVKTSSTMLSSDWLSHFLENISDVRAVSWWYIQILKSFLSVAQECAGSTSTKTKCSMMKVSSWKRTCVNGASSGEFPVGISKIMSTVNVRSERPFVLFLLFLCYSDDDQGHTA